MHKTLLLCFIHGFKGGDDTFGGFPEYLRALVSHALPKITVTAVTYPKFETRGDLHECVGRFRECASTPSPTIDPSVRTILVGHSMGGIVAAETLLSILSDNPIAPAPHTPPPSTSANTTPMPKFSEPSETAAEGPTTFMFPYIQGILAFDTPYLGISPSVIAHGAETHFKTASSAYTTFSEFASALGYSSAQKSPSAAAATNQQPPQKLLAEAPSPMSTSATAAAGDAAATPAWQRWGKYAMFAGAAGAVAAGGAAVYAKRERIGEGWGWIGSHLEFVGCLMRGEELKTRLERVVALKKEKGVGFVNLVTVLGKGGGAPDAENENEIKTIDTASTTWTSLRTFCTIPKTPKNKILFEKAINQKASDEMAAHMCMFHPRENPGYYAMSERAKELVTGWVEEAWYEGSEGANLPEESREGMGGGMMLIENESAGGEEGTHVAQPEKKGEDDGEDEMEDVALGGEPVLVESA